MRVLALDHGTVRIGVAASDELKMLAHPMEFIPAEPFNEFLERLKQIIREKEVEQIVVGMPRNMDGSYGPSAEKVRQFIIVLKEIITIPIRPWDERLTSVQANRLMIEGGVKGKDKREKVDKMAAAILLQSYLDAIGGNV
jgi:putative holliday junction resolvase